MNIYFLGGSFDPPHLGHLRIAQYFSNECDLFLFIPAKKSPFKSLNPIASPKQRIEMLAILSKKVDNSKIDTFEIDSEDDSYTYLTIKYLINKYSPQNLNMIIGKDNLLGLKRWKEFDYISQNCNIVCVDRNINYPQNNHKINDISFVDFNENISSTQIKKLLKYNSISLLNNFMDENVINYILENRLYI